MSCDDGTVGSAQEATPASTLPNRSPDRTWGGPGSGGPCAACGEPVKTDEIEYELEFAREGPAGSLERAMDVHRVHARCFVAWERKRMGRSANASPPDPLERAETPDAAAEGSVESQRALRATSEGATFASRERESASNRKWR